LKNKAMTVVPGVQQAGPEQKEQAGTHDEIRIDRI
jgi:hypothetical protein